MQLKPYHVNVAIKWARTDRVFNLITSEKVCNFILNKVHVSITLAYLFLDGISRNAVGVGLLEQYMECKERL